MTFGDVLGDREFRSLWVAQLLSVAGDQLARVAISVLVFNRTGSTLLTGAAYATTFLPWIVAGPVTAGLADRLPRRALMIVCDVVRAVTVSAVAIPGMPLWLMLAILFFGGLFAPPFSAARAALMPQVFPDEGRYIAASAIGITTDQSAQIVGFAVGGALVGLVGARTSLVIDGLTFLASALAVVVGVRSRAAAKIDRPSRGRSVADLRDGAMLIFRNPRLRKLVMLAWLCGFSIVPEALAVPYVSSRGGGAAAVGLMLAASPVGVTVGAVLVGRFFSTSTRRRWMLPMAVLSGVPLIACVAQPGLLITWLLWAISGVFGAYDLAANAEFALAVPNASRGQAFGLVVSGMMVAQGIGLLLAGLLAEFFSPLSVVAVAGVLIVLCAGYLSAVHIPSAPPLTKA
ncbi:MAG: MFS transporter [Mycobacteriales bacterium]